MKNSLTLAAAATAVMAVLSGCGSSYSASSSSGSSTSSKAASTAASGGLYGGNSTSTAPATAKGVSLAAKHDKLGTVLAAGPKRLTVYLFESDHGGVSSCSGECAKVWPPVTTQGAPASGAGAKANDIATITRPDGSKQVTYKGHPLYYFAKDKDDGDAYGQGLKSFGAAWYVLSPAGVKIDPS